MERRPPPLELWIPITLFAAFCQNLRSALQKHLKGRLLSTRAPPSRASPMPYRWRSLRARAGRAVRRSAAAAQPDFRAHALLGGLAQIIATALLLYSFSFRNFAVGTTYSKTETVQTAIFGVLILGDPLGLGRGLAILISLVGVMAISVARPTTFRSLLTA